MFDNSKEIIWLLNLMLRNDKKPLLKTKDYFDSDGNFIEANRTQFINKIRGYISYVRGENPYRFPERLYPITHKNTIKHK